MTAPVIDLSKGKQPLTGRDGLPALNVLVGLGWDINVEKGVFGGLKNRRGVDLDLTAIVLDAAGAALCVCDGQNKTNYVGGMSHGGDNTSGKGNDNGGYDETLILQPADIGWEAAQIALCVTAYKDKKSNGFARTNGVYYGLEDNGTVLVKTGVPIEPGNNAVIVASLDRVPNTTQWTIRPVKKLLTAAYGPQAWRDVVTQAKRQHWL